MPDQELIDVTRLIDDQPIRLFHLQLLALTFLILISDGYDLQVIGFAAPGLVKLWHINRAALGPVFSASVVGMLFGAPISGWAGDRFGRRRLIILGTLAYATFTLLCSLAQTLPQLILLRFLIGLGLGGIPVNTVALIAEYAPRRVRATLIMIAQIGITVGSLLPALASAALEHDYGWRSLFLVGAAGPLAIGIASIFLLPESIKYLVAQQKSSAKIYKLALALNPTLACGANPRFILEQSPFAGGQRAGLKALFVNGLQWITPLIWSLFIIVLIGNYFLHSWMPILFRDAGLTIRQTALTAAMFDIGGVAGALLISRFLDKYGIVAILVFFVLSCPAVASIGLIASSVTLLRIDIFISGFCLVGITLGMNAVAALLYPTEIRAKSVGWAYGIGRIGSFLGPLLGGWLIGMNLPIDRLFFAMVLPLVLGTILSALLLRLCRRRSHGIALDDQTTSVLAE